MVGAKDTLGRHYAFEEARFRLGELDIEVQSDVEAIDNDTPAAILVLAEGMNELAIRTVLESYEEAAVVVLDELQSIDWIQDFTSKRAISDLTTALYDAAWATMLKVES